jgi:hypothetical protein
MTFQNSLKDRQWSSKQLRKYCEALDAVLSLQNCIYNGTQYLSKRAKGKDPTNNFR